MTQSGWSGSDSRAMPRDCSTRSACSLEQVLSPRFFVPSASSMSSACEPERSAVPAAGEYESAMRCGGPEIRRDPRRITHAVQCCPVDQSLAQRLKLILSKYPFRLSGYGMRTMPWTNRWHLPSVRGL